MDFNYLSNITSLSSDTCVFYTISFVNHVHKHFFIPLFIFYLFLQRNLMMMLCLLRSSDLFRDWDRWEAEFLR